MSSAARTYLLLSSHCFLAFAALGTFYPYFALFLRENVGLSSSQVGLVISIPPMVGLFAQPAWGQLADRTGSRVRVLMLLCVGAAIGFATLSRAHGMGATIAATCVLALFLSALFPMSTSVVLGALPSWSLFGRVRVWGTVGYLAMVVSAPRVLGQLREAGVIGSAPEGGGPSEPGLPLMFYVAALCCVLSAVAAWFLPSNAGLAAQAERGGVRALFADPAFRGVLLYSTGIQFFLNGPMQLFPLFVRSRGGSVTDLSNLWICMASLEVPLIFSSHRLFRAIGVTRMMLIASAGGGIRWVVCALVPTLSGVYPVQALHALVVTGLNVGTALYVEQIVPVRLRSTAQSTVVMVGSSVGGVLSSVIGGADRGGMGRRCLIPGRRPRRDGVGRWLATFARHVVPSLGGHRAAPAFRAARVRDGTGRCPLCRGNK